jgi:hypothetical protein
VDTLTHEDVSRPTGSGGVIVVFAVINANPSVSDIP